MEIDGRDISQKDILLAVRDAISDDRNEEINVVVLVSSKEDARHVKAYSSMTGYGIDVSQSDDHFVVKITGCNCRCG
jgi:hypothetical protein